jgi:hypothetical protein
MSEPSSGDLVVLVADANIEFAIRGLLTRYRSLGIRRVSTAVFRHPRRDPGCLRHGHDFLRSYPSRFAHGLVVFDRDGCGDETESRTELESRVEELLGVAGWADRAQAVVIDPELESWVWSNSPHVDTALGWTDREPDLRTWLASEGLLVVGASKPDRPKEALECALRAVHKPRSSSIYHEIAAKVSLKGCLDPAFGKLVSVLQNWFAHA